MMKKFQYFTFVILTIILINSCNIENPGPIDADALNNKEAIPAIVVGMSADFSRAFRHATLWGTIWSDELTFSGTYAAPTSFVGGHLTSARVGPWWNEAQRARWEAEHGIKKIKKLLSGEEFESNKNVARAYLWAGYSNRSLGFNACKAVIDGGKAQSDSVYFQRAKKYFTKASTIAKNIENEEDLYAALGGRASVNAALGNWKKAAKDAKQVPVDYKFDAIYSENSSRENNLWWDRTYNRGQYTVYGTKWVNPDDPRLPQQVIYTDDGDTAKATNGEVPWIRQNKYTKRGTDIPLTKGTSMILVRAENELRTNNDVQAAMKLINKERSYYGLSKLEANSLEEVWHHLEMERGKVLWLQGRRFWDLRRWFKDEGPAHNDFLKGRDKCAPIGEQELDTNQNL